MTPSDDSPPRCEPAANRSARIGFGLFWIYVACYGGFIALVLFAPGLLSARPFGGVNLAIACGLGLIVAALVLAVVLAEALAVCVDEPVGVEERVAVGDVLWVRVRVPVGEPDAEGDPVTDPLAEAVRLSDPEPEPL